MVDGSVGLVLGAGCCLPHYQEVTVFKHQGGNPSSRFINDLAEVANLSSTRHLGYKKLKMCVFRVRHLSCRCLLPGACTRGIKNTTQG